MLCFETGEHNHANTATEHSICMWCGFDIHGTPSALGASFAGGHATRAAANFLAEPGLVKTALQAVATGKKAAFAPTVSKIIHQTWKSRVLPPHLAALTERWKALHPGWTYKLWTDEECAAFVAAVYPEFEPRYKSFPYAIQRFDAIRYLVLRTYGGVYLDLDMFPLKSLDFLADSTEFVLSTEPVE